LLGTKTAGWVHRTKTTVLSYLQFHPLAALWLCLLILVLAGVLGSRLRHLPPHPYPASTRWRPAQPAGPALSLALAAVPDLGHPVQVAAGSMRAGGVANDPAYRASGGRPVRVGSYVNSSAVAAQPSRDRDGLGSLPPVARPRREPAEPSWSALDQEPPRDPARSGPTSSDARPAHDHQGTSAEPAHPWFNRADAEWAPAPAPPRPRRHRADPAAPGADAPGADAHPAAHREDRDEPTDRILATRPLPRIG
jgi:hypothetical protein